MSKHTEEAIIFCLLDNPSLIMSCSLDADDFLADSYKLIYSAIVECSKTEGGHDVVQVVRALQDMNRPNAAELAESIFRDGIASPSQFPKYCAQTKADSQKRQAKMIAQELSYNLDHNSDVDAVGMAIQKLMRIGQASDKHSHTMKEAVTAGLEAIQDAYDKDGIVGVPTGMTELDDALGGFHDSDLVIIGARPAMGKAQPLDAQVLLESGKFIAMGDVSIGDNLASVDGKASQVTGIFPQGERDIYRVELSDGRVVECDLEHLWNVSSCKFDGTRTLTTNEIMQMLAKERFQNRIRLVSHSGEFGGTSDIGVDPWLLGFLLGDGSLTQSCVRFSTSEDYILDRVSAVIPQGLTIEKAGGYDYRISGQKGARNPIKKWIDEQGLACVADSKFIPKIVFEASRSIRAQVIAGLIESDGWVQSQSVQYASASESLALGVQALVRSLGGCASLRKKSITQYKHKGEQRTGKASYIVSISLDDIEQIVSSPRIKSNLYPRKKTCSPIIRSITFSRKAQAQCIMVSHPEHLYITDGYAVTHNTALLVSLSNSDVPAGIISAEQNYAQLGQRYLANQGSVHSQNMRTASLNENEWTRLSAAARVLTGRNQFINDEGSISLSGLVQQAREWKFKHDIKILYVDYLQKIRTRQGANKVEQVTEVTYSLKNLAKELNIPVVALAQVKRDVDSRTDTQPQIGDMSDASEIEKEADVIITLKRDEAYDPDTERKGIADLLICKNRHGPTGLICCQFVGKYFQFKNFGSAA